MTDEERADEIVGRCRRRLDEGDPLDVDEVVRAHPELSAVLRERFAALARLDRAFVRPAPTTSLAGRALGRYQLVSELGSGGMGTVYLASDAGASVAIKVVHPHLAARDGYVERFLREADLGRRVRHANVVATLDAGTAELDGAAVRFLAMEYVQGRTLRALLEETERLPEELCRHVGREIAKALAAIHAAGAVHRDLKPDNVLVTREHVVKVMDLGVARVLDDAARLSQTGAFVGSLLYGAPEQLRKGAQVDGRADLHALGLVLFELATGAHPFGDDFALVPGRLLSETPRRLGRVDPQLSPFLEELVAQLLEKDPGRRPASAADVARILDEGESSAWWHERSAAIRRETRRPLRRIRIARETALHGRDAEMSALRALFEKAKSGDGQVVLVEGEAGIGKSRLVDEFTLALWASGEDVDFLFGSYPPGGAATASGAFSTAYREHLGDDEAAIRDALPQTPLLVPAFAALLRGDVPPEGAEKLTKDSLQTVFVHATRSFAARRTTLVFIDDLHFAPEEGRALFASLALAVPGRRILLVGGARPALDEKWVAGVARLPHLTRLSLPRLGAKDLVRLLNDALKSQHLAEELAGKIATKSDGNPFFVFEILRGLREGQFITKRSDGTWATTKEIREIQVPSSIVELVQARVSDLSRADRNVLEVASCLGFEFDAALVGDVLKIERIPLLQTLGAIEKSHRLVRSAGRRFVFDHHQVMEVLYAGLSEPLREEYHAAIGAAIEARSGAASKEPTTLDGALCVELAEHFLRGAQGPRALRYLDAALTHLEVNYLNDAAIRLLDCALAAPELVAGRARLELLLRKSARLELVGRRDAERVSLDQALGLADADGDAALRARARRALGGHLLKNSRNDEAIARLSEAQELARDAGDRRTEADAVGNLGVVLTYVSRFAQSQQHLEWHLALAREIGDRSGEADATGNLGNVFRHLGRFAESQHHHERHIALAREIGDRWGEAAGMGNLGNVFESLGRFAESQHQYERHLALVREIGDRRGEAAAMGNLGNIFQHLGRFAESQHHYERQLALAQEIGDRRGETAVTCNLGVALRTLGRFADARSHGQRALALARQIGDRTCEAVGLVNLGPLLDDLGDGAGAREALTSSLAICREIGNRWVAGYALLRLGEAVASAGDRDEALRLVEESLALRRELGTHIDVTSSLLARGRLRVAQGDLAAACTDFAEAGTLAREMGLHGDAVLAVAHAATLPGGDVAVALAALSAHEARIGLPTLLESRFLLWTQTRDGAHLAEAKRLLDHLVEHAPPECRESMLTNVRLHRDIAEAARANGIA